MLNKIILFLSILLFTACNQKPMYNTIYKLEEINLTNLTQDTIVLVDIDDTIITPKSKFFRHHSKYNTIIDDIKRDKNKITNHEEILSNWRLQRKIMLVDQTWSTKISSSNVPIYALTKMDSGKIGNIPSMEKWRYNELKELNIIFTKKFNNLTGFSVMTKDKAKPAIFYNGIFMTSSFSKGEVVKKIIEISNYKKIIFIDDRLEHVEDVALAAKELNINCQCILYRGVELLEGTPDEKIAELQKNTLLTNAKWLEDDEAEKN